MRVDNLLKQLKPLIPAALIGLIGLSIYYATDIYILFLSGLLLSYFLHVMVQAVNWVLCRLIPIKDLNHVLWGLSIFISILIYALLIGLIFWIIAPSITLQYKYFSNLITSDTYNSIIDKVTDIINQPFFAQFKHLLEPNIASINHEMILKVSIFAKDLINRLLLMASSVIYSAHNLIYVLVTCLLAFHIVREWNLWWPRIQGLRTVNILSPYSERIESFMLFCGSKMQAWIRGQIIIASAMSVYYFICFMLIGLHSPILFGFIFGWSSFVPYISDLLSFSTLFINLLHMNASLFTIVLSIAVVFVGHGLSGYIVGPLLIGKTTKINIVQALIGLILHIKVFGPAGIILNIPFCIITNGFLRMILYKPEQLELEN